MDISNGSHTDDDRGDGVAGVSCIPDAQLPHSFKSNGHPHSNGDSRSPIKTPQQDECISFDQEAVDVAVMKSVLQYLDKYKISPEELSDDQLKSCIQSIIADAPYHLNLRSASAGSYMSLDSCQSR